MKLLSFKSGAIKVLSVLMAMLLVFGMVACRDEDVTPGTTTPTQENTTPGDLEVKDPEPVVYSDATIERMSTFMNRMMGLTEVAGMPATPGTDEMIDVMTKKVMMPAYSVNFVSEADVVKMLDTMEAYLDNGEALIEDLQNPSADMTEEKMMEMLKGFIDDSFAMIEEMFKLFTPELYGEITYDSMLLLTDVYVDILTDTMNAVAESEVAAIKEACELAIEHDLVVVMFGQVIYYEYDPDITNIEDMEIACVIDGEDEDAYIAYCEDYVKNFNEENEGVIAMFEEVMAGMKTTLNTIGKETFADMVSISYHSMSSMLTFAPDYVDAIMGGTAIGEVVDVADIVTLAQSEVKYMADLDITEEEWAKFADVAVFWVEYVAGMKMAVEGEAPEFNDIIMMVIGGNNGPDDSQREPGAEPMNATAEVPSGTAILEQIIEELDPETYLRNAFKVIPEMLDFMSAIVNSIDVDDVEAAMEKIQSGEAVAMNVIVDVVAKSFNENKAAFLELAASIEKNLATDAGKGVVEDAELTEAFDEYMNAMGKKSAEDLYNAVVAAFEDMTDEAAFGELTATAMAYANGLLPYFLFLANNAG